MTAVCQESRRRPRPPAPLFLRPSTGCVWAIAWLLAATTGTTVADPAPGDLPAGKWLMDRARHYSLSAGDAHSVGGARLMLVWARAASRISPDLAEAYFGHYNLLELLGRPDEARQALDTYCTLAEDDEVHRLILLGERFEQLQTAERRLEFCRRHLGQHTLPAPLASELNRWLAQTYRGTGETDLARKHARQAVDLYPFNFTAWELLFDLQDALPGPVEHAKRRLAAIAANPSLTGETWALARLLDSLSLHDRAAVWYFGALAALARFDPDPAVANALLLDLARSYHDAGSFDDALKFSQQVVQADPGFYDARLLLIETARRAGRREIVAEQIAVLRKQLAESEADVRQSRDAPGAARVAWFHVDCDPQPEKALAFAEIALSAAPDDRQVRRVHGLALLAARRPAEARKALAPLTAGADADQLAAWGLAKALLDLDERDAALTVLRDAEQLRRSGMAYERVVESLEQLGAAALPPPDRSRVLAVLDEFDRDVLDFPVNPGRYLRLSAVMVNPTPRFAERWRCRFTLANQGTFPITIGPGQMVAGSLLVSADVHVPGLDPIEGYLPLSLARRHVLNAGEHVEVEQTLDVGPLARVAAMMPQRSLEVAFTVVLDPEQPQGRRKSRLGDELVVSARLHRQKVAYTPAVIRPLENAGRSGTPPRRIEALRTMAALLAERLAAMRGQFDYEPVRIDKKGLEAVLRQSLGDPDPMVRACALDSLVMLPLDEDRVQAAAPLLSDSHWLVRLVAVDTLAVRQGPVFRPVAERLAESDPDPLVRELARLHLQRWEAGGTQR